MKGPIFVLIRRTPHTCIPGATGIYDKYRASPAPLS
jgi:hypothetical protein